MALLGRLGWLFLCNRRTMSQLSGQLRLADRQLLEYKEAFHARWARFEQLGIPYVFLPIPMKEVLYKEFLPEELSVDTKDLPYDLVVSLFESDPHVEITDLRPTLREARCSADVYPRTNHHLSALGAHSVYVELTKHPAFTGLKIQPKPIEDFPLRVEGRYRGDLADKEKVVFEDGRFIRRGQGTLSQYTEVALLFDLDSILPMQLPLSTVPIAYNVSDTRPTRIYERPERSDLPRAVVVGDSFMWTIMPFLMEHFHRITCTWVPNPPFSVIESERPDIVIQPMAERYLIRSPLMPDWELGGTRPVGFEPGAVHEAM